MKNISKEKKKFKKKTVKYRWNERHFKFDKDNQIILRQVANQDNFELSIMHKERFVSSPWNTIRMTRNDVDQVHKMVQELFITLKRQDDEKKRQDNEYTIVNVEPEGEYLQVDENKCIDDNGKGSYDKLE